MAVKLRYQGRLIRSNMNFIVDGKPVPGEYLFWRELNFGQTVQLKLVKYEIHYPTNEFVTILQQPYSEWLSEMRADFEQTGDTDPEYLQRLDYPSLDVLMRHPEELSSAIKVYLYRDLFDQAFRSFPLEAARWIINTVDDVAVGKDSIVVAGLAFEPPEHSI